ncbi:GntR family transcriptional regulator [Serinibacter arcticus]|uniref:GntR family transcriptional regulator n=1 Tax=Serinibacter arcticus TaxID=1655435 RepID=UPI001304FA5F|nr:GntR family transcriptional regulator [Serinibacter arcticus]
MTALRDMVLSGDLRPGERLNEVGLADALGISRAPLREAIQHLRSEGLLTAVAGRGAYVRSLTPTELEELFEVRHLLEIHALRLAAARATPQELETLRADMSERGHLFDTFPSRPQENDFHLRIARLAGNSALLAVITDVHRQTQLVRQQIADSNHAHPDRILHEHADLIEALIAGDVDRAEAILVEHLRVTMAEGMAILEGR